MPGLQRTVTIAAPPERVWAVVVDVERWPERIPTVDAIERLDAGPLAVGSRTRLQQPRLPTAVWTVTELADGSSYTWESSSPGVTITATHVVEPHPAGSRLTLALRSRGQRQPADRPDLRANDPAVRTRIQQLAAGCR